jgi:hypothetical protein
VKSRRFYLLGIAMLRLSACLAVLLLAACQSEGTSGEAGRPALSVAWDAGEGVRFLLIEGCIPAVAQKLNVKEAVDRGSSTGLSRVRTLDRSPITNDPAGTPAYALMSSASVVITGTAERCRVASASGDAAAIRDVALKAVSADASWVSIAPPASEAGANFTIDARCQPISGGVMLLTMLAAKDASAPLRFQAIVSRSDRPSCAI